jgi:hypothetical protein
VLLEHVVDADELAKILAGSHYRLDDPDATWKMDGGGQWVPVVVLAAGDQSATPSGGSEKLETQRGQETRPERDVAYHEPKWSSWLAAVERMLVPNGREQSRTSVTAAAGSYSLNGKNAKS